MSDEQLDSFQNADVPSHVDLHSVCYNIRGVMNRDGFGNEYPLILNPENTRPRRTRSCPTGFCSSSNQDLNEVLQRGDKLTSCDEFPFASTEEGGRPGIGLSQTVRKTRIPRKVVANHS